jgi:thioredoxin 1
MALDVNASNFETQVLRSPTPVLVDFWAEWCQPCKMLMPVLESVRDQIKVVKINIDDASAAGLAARFRINSIPTLVFFNRGQEVHRITGLTSEQNLKNQVQYANSLNG